MTPWLREARRDADDPAVVVFKADAHGSVPYPDRDGSRVAASSMVSTHAQMLMLAGYEVIDDRDPR